MSNLHVIKSQIKSVKSIEKITKAMRVIASVKFSACQKKIANFSQYLSEITGLMNVIKWHWNENKYSDLDWLFNSKHKDNSPDEIKKYNNPLLIILFSDMGLCGDINSSLSSFANNYVDCGFKTVIVGKKGIGKFKSDLYMTYDDLLSQIGSLIFKHDACFMIFNDFISMLNHSPSISCIFPFISENTIEDDFTIFEPEYQKIANQVFQIYLSAKLQEIIYKQNLSEYSTRVISMNNANDNANSIINKLRLSYNHSRQSKITQEIIEVISGMGTMGRR